MRFKGKKRIAYLEIKSPFTALAFEFLLAGDSTCCCLLLALAKDETLRVPAEFSLVYRESPWRAARSRMLRSTVSTWEGQVNTQSGGKHQAYLQRNSSIPK